MFTTLVFKEWREKALVFFFELGILGFLFAAQFVMRDKADLQEWLIYAILLLFFPFAALILGASGFEAEYRQGAWAYLFSRPVGRPVIWLAKFSALVSMLANLWLVFFVAWATLPSVRGLARLPSFILLGYFGNGFPWWSFGLSLFLLTVAFSLSLLHGRPFNILFVALIAGLLFPGATWALITSKTGGFMAWSAPARAFRTLLIGLVLTTLAFAGASLLTLIRSDFSQSRKRMRTFIGSFAVFIVLAVAGTVGSAVFVPIPGERYLDFMCSSDGMAIYATERGLFSCESGSSGVRWLTKRRNINSWFHSVSAGRLAYSVFDIKGPRDATQEIWVTGTDGTGRKRLIGRDTAGAWPPDDSVVDLTISPDGRTVAILTRDESERRKSSSSTAATLWTVNSDGSGLGPRSLETILSDGSTERLWLSFVTWAREGKVLIFLKRCSFEPVLWSLWAYDLDRKTASKLRDSAVPASPWRLRNSAPRDILAIRNRYSDEGPRTLALLNLATGEETEIARGEESSFSWVRWDPSGERMSFIIKKTDQEGLSSYILMVYSVTAGKAVAERADMGFVRTAYTHRTAWMPDGRSIVVIDNQGRCLRIFDESLQETGRIDLPARIKGAEAFVEVVGKQILAGGGEADALWRFDLEKKRWKRLY